MDFLLPEDLAEFRGSLRSFFSDTFTSSMLRSRMIDSGKEIKGDEDAEIWSQIAELGLLLAAVPEEFDGLGFGTLAAEVVLTEAGRTLTPVPLFETLALGAIPLLAVGNEQSKAELIPSIATGEVKFSGAFEALYNTDSQSSLTAEAKGDDFLISGDASFVPSVRNVDRLLVPATSNEGVGLYLIDLSDQEIKSDELTTFDLLRRYYKVQFSKTKATLVSDAAISSDQLQQLALLLSVLTTSEMNGAADAALHLSLEHVQTRKQFGKPIGSFQAVAHKLSDMHLECESATALNRFAAWCADTDPAQFNDAARASKAYASEYLPKALQTAVQVHGGIGFTYEYDLHLYLRRVRVGASLFGDREQYYEALGA